MKTKDALALVAFILGIIGGALLLRDGINVVTRLIEGSRHANLESLLLLGIGIIAIIASAMLWRGSYMTAGVINMVLGIIALVYGRDAEGLMILISGILGIVAPKIKG
ncbi:MAG: hypothetical protein PVF15_11100 [Candidatus Bathyarchaeota archaeon]|jgi:hypothetical protein